MGDSGLRQRKKKPSKVQQDYGRGGGDAEERKKEKSGNPALWYISTAVGLAVMWYMGYHYSVYCDTQHENRMFFTNIKQVEREISFRTESGLYYSYYKQLVKAPSLSQGLYSLMNDNLTEYTTTMNVLARMNIYQEVFLGIIYRASTSLQKSLHPIYFYLYSIYNLQGVLLAAIYLLAWGLCKSWLGGVLAAGLYVYNKDHTTRSPHTAPLRENFSLPFMWWQLAAISFYFMPGKKAIRDKICIPVIFLSTFAFAVTWQFNQFIMLTQSMALFGVQVLQLIPHKKVLTVYIAQLVALALVAVVQFFNTMIITGPLFCFVPAAIIVMKIQGDRPTGSPVVVRFLNVLWYIVLVFAISAAFVLVSKLLVTQDSDAHIFRFLMIKFGLAKNTWDFDVQLYICNGAFGFMEPSVIEDLTKSLVLPTYGLYQLGILVAMLIALCQKWSAERSLHVSRDLQPLTEEDHQPHILSSRPELAYHAIQAVFFGIVALSVTRMKYLWVPYMCVMMAVCIGDLYIWKLLLKKLQCTDTIAVYLLQSLAIIGSLGLLWHAFKPMYDEEMKTLREFYDPDTVDLMEWISKKTPPTSVYAGSMQLLAGVKLCTDRAITNHPHYEDTHLRQRTRELYQMYGRREPAEMHAILKKYGTTHVILEDSICLVQKTDACGTPTIIDISYGEIPDNGIMQQEGLVKSNVPRFCDQVRYLKGEYAKWFKIAFKNKTFRVYQLL